MSDYCEVCQKRKPHDLRADAKYCSAACKQKAVRMRQAEALRRARQIDEALGEFGNLLENGADRQTLIAALKAIH